MNEIKRETSPLRGNALILSLSLLAILLEVIPTLFGGYGYFIDEWYYIACARRLAFGFVDHPPLAPLLLRGMLILAGGSLFWIRLLPALAAGVTVFLTGRMARELGGGTFAQGLACLSTIGAPGVLVSFGFFSVNAFEIPLWVSCCYLLLLIMKTGDPRRWILFGIVAGLGLETKHTMVLLGIGTGVGLLLTPARHHFARKPLWLGVAIAFLILLPNLVWQYVNGWPSLEFYANATLYKNLATPPLKGLLNQVVAQNPATFPIWVSGLVYFLFSKEGRSFRPIGWIFVTLFLLLLASQSSRPDRITGIYPVMFAGGGVAIESFSLRRRVPRLRPVLTGLLILGGILLAPVALPILPPDVLAEYNALLKGVPKIEKGKTSPLPQWFADRFDWDTFVATVAGIYDRLPEEDKRRAVIFAPSYGHAGSLEFYRASLGLPRVICNHNNYYLWGKGNANADILIAIGAIPADLRRVYAKVDSVGIIRGTYGMSWRNNMPVYLARIPTTPLNDVWDRIKNFE